MRKTCAAPACGREFEAKRAAAKYCGDRCRKRGQRAAPKLAPVVDLPPPAPPTDGEPAPGPLTAVTRRELEGAGRLDTPLGVAALLLAQRLDGIGLADTGSGVAALMKDYRAGLAEALKDAKSEGDTLDRIRESAALKLVSGGSR